MNALKHAALLNEGFMETLLRKPCCWERCVEGEEAAVTYVRVCFARSAKQKLETGSDLGAV